MRFSPFDLIIDRGNKVYWIGVLSFYWPKHEIHLFKIGWLENRFSFRIMAYDFELMP
jgi:hypothetical protein